MSGTFVNSFAGMERSGSPASFGAMDMRRIGGNRIAQTWHYELPREAQVMGVRVLAMWVWKAVSQPVRNSSVEAFVMVPSGVNRPGVDWI